MAWISLAKLPLFLFCLISFSSYLVRGRSDQQLEKTGLVRLILAILGLFALSLLWTEADSSTGLMAFFKHGKLLEIVLLISLIHSRREALLALGVFLAGQAFFVLSSWLMIAGYRVPWATSLVVPHYQHVVYSSYLDQTLIFSASAAIFWHLRSYWPKLTWLSSTLALLAVVNILFFQDGKTGYVAALAVLTLAVMWQIPTKWRMLSVLIAPLALGLIAYAGSAKVQYKVAQVMNDSQNYSQLGNNESSSGFRLHAWKRSLQAIAEQPLIGHGVGSWTQVIKRIEGKNADKIFGTDGASNPHQEYLLWGVELGLIGILLMLTWLVLMVRQALQFDMPAKQATVSVVAVMLIACLFNSSLYDALIGDFFCVALGLLLAMGLRDEVTATPSAAPTATSN
jgi:O-antigen ligase